MPSLPNKPLGRRAGASRLATLVLLMVWFVVLGLVALNRQNIVDWWRLRDYQAPAPIAVLADQATMTSYGRKVFYVNRPAIDDKQAFTEDCPSNGGEQTIVLGCYHAAQSGIFLLSVDDTRLEGVQQVTAAHEMLHAAYDRLSPAERKRVDGLLKAYYDDGLQDERIRKTIEAYKQSEPNDLVNEMHSIFGSEVASLPAPLEDYYKRYFTDRRQVAAYAAKYQLEFSSRRDLIARYDRQLTDLKARIDNLEADLRNKQAEIESRQHRLDALRGSDASAYNASVPGYNALVDAYNAEVRQTQALIAQYNQLITTRNAVAEETDQLVKELSSEVAPINR